MIKCTSCGFMNDATRVFCQNCGARLERVQGAPSAAQPHRYEDKSARPVRHRSGFIRLISALFNDLIRLALIAAITAAIILMVQSPDDVPAAIPVRAPAASMLAADIRATMESPFPRSKEISQESANNFLAARVEGAPASPEAWRAVFSRAYVVMQTGSISLGIEKKFRNYPLYLQLRLEPGKIDGKTTLEPVGGSIGRLPIPGFLASFFMKLFEPVIAPLSAQASWLEKASALTFSPGTATVQWPANSWQEYP